MIFVPDFESDQIHAISLPSLPVPSGAIEHHFLMHRERIRVLAFHLETLHGSVILEPATTLLELHLSLQNPTVFRT